MAPSFKRVNLFSVKRHPELAPADIDFVLLMV
jgi:hypothetical protein